MNKNTAVQITSCNTPETKQARQPRRKAYAVSRYQHSDPCIKQNLQISAASIEGDIHCKLKMEQFS